MKKKYKEEKILGFTKREWSQSGLKTIGLFILMIVLLNLVAVSL